MASTNCLKGVMRASAPQEWKPGGMPSPAAVAVLEKEAGEEAMEAGKGGEGDLSELLGGGVMSHRRKHTGK